MMLRRDYHFICTRPNMDRPRGFKDVYQWGEENVFPWLPEVGGLLIYSFESLI